jgi:dTDP-4-dehydrorhamnose 3,5-epimerase
MTQRFKFSKTKLDGPQVIERTEFEDVRGSFSRFFCEEEFKSSGFKKSIKQINLSSTKRKGVIRGLHFQSSPYSESKIVTCIKGEIFDVAVDIRQSSSTYLQWHGVVLSPNRNNSFLIPEGFAHGFQTLADNCELLYMHSEFYNQDSEGVLNAFDPKIGISWPLSVLEMSDRDRKAKMIYD